MSLATMRNPFLHEKADDTRFLPPGNVAQLHADVLARCTSLIQQAQETGYPMSSLIVGEAGSGKSHLIIQLREQLAAISTCVLVSIRMNGTFAGRLWRHVRSKLVEELFLEYKQDVQGANALLRILRNRFPKWAETIQKPDKNGGLLDWFIGKSKNGITLQNCIEKFTQNNSLDYSLVKVLSQMDKPEKHVLARNWLSGIPMGKDDLEKLGLSPVYPSEQQQEVESREMIMSLLRLAGDQTMMYICFDEIEKIQSGNWDPLVLREFTTLATDLLSDAGPRVLTIFLRPLLRVDIERAVEKSNLQKLEQHHSAIPPITWEQTTQIVLGRLNAEVTMREARQIHSSANKFWPLDEAFVQKVFQAHKRIITPRHIIKACKVQVDWILAGRVGQEPTVIVVKPLTPLAGLKTTGEPDEKPAVKSDFQQYWEKVHKRVLIKSQGIQFDQVMGIALPWLIDIRGIPLKRTTNAHSLFAHLNMHYEGADKGAKSLGISLCNQEPRVVWRRLKTILDNWHASKGKMLNSLVVLRAANSPRSAGMNGYIDQLVQAGVTVVMVEQQQLIDLAAFQVMLTAANAGEVVRMGEPITAHEYSAWAKDHLTQPVLDLFGQIVGSGIIPAKPTAPAPAKAVAVPTAKPVKPRVAIAKPAPTRK